jgi:hypothetical protein
MGETMKEENCPDQEKQEIGFTNDKRGVKH